MRLLVLGTFFLATLSGYAFAQQGAQEEPAAPEWLANLDDSTVQIGEEEGGGQYLVDAEGMALYIYLEDSPNSSTCYEQCATNWPPLTAEGEPTAGEGVDAALLGTIERTDGTMQVTYNEWPLYRFARDAEPGNTRGHNLGQVFSLISPAGEAVTATEAEPAAEPAAAAPAAPAPAPAAAPAAPAAEAAEAEGPFEAGTPLELMPNTQVFGSFRFAESCVYDESRDLYVIPNAGIRSSAENELENDGYVSLINPDGTVHTLKWIGVNRNGLTLNHPLGSDLANGMLYLADVDTVRWFDIATGEPTGEAVVEGAAVLNDLAVGEDGTIYASQHGNQDGTVPWRLYKITPDGEASIFIEGAPLARPNGVAFDSEGNIVVVNIGSDEILTFSSDGELLATEMSLNSGNDGLVIMSDGTKYVSSVVEGTVAVIRPGEPAELVASGIPSAASMCYDPTRNRLIVPMNNWDAIAFVELN